MFPQSFAIERLRSGAYRSDQKKDRGNGRPVHFAQMYHHFHDEGRHKPGQGSIDAETFDRVLGATLARGIEILPPEVYMDRAIDGRLQPNETALTFDDRLRCQSDIAVPVMEARGLRGFFFLYTATEGPDRTMFEFYRDYRNTFFEDIEAFYALAFETAEALFDPDWAEINAAVTAVISASFRSTSGTRGGSAISAIGCWGPTAMTGSCGA